MFGHWVDEWIYVPDLHPCTLNGEQRPQAVCTFHFWNEGSCTSLHQFWTFILKASGGTTAKDFADTACEMPRGRSIESRSCILPCDVNTFLALWQCALETMWDQTRAQVTCSSEMPAEICGKLPKCTRPQCFDVDGSLLSFLVSVKMYYLNSLLSPTYKIHFHVSH